MGFFTTFWSWLNGQLATYIGSNTARLATALEPAVVTTAIIYVMAWGYLHLTGQIDEPVVAGLKRIMVLVVAFGVSLDLWLYNAVIVDTFYKAPAQLAAAVTGSKESGGAVAGNLWTKGHLMGWFSGFGFIVGGTVVWCLMGLLCVYAMFLIALSDIALAVLLALGPLFVAMLFFEATKRMFSAWIAQLATYALITILTVMMASLLLQIVQSYASQTAARGSAIVTVDALNMILVAMLVFLILRQIMPIAASLAGGLSLNTFGMLSRPLGWVLRQQQNLAATYVLPRLGGTIAKPLRESARASRWAIRQAGAGIDVLSRHWRRPRS